MKNNGKWEALQMLICETQECLSKMVERMMHRASEDGEGVFTAEDLLAYKKEIIALSDRSKKFVWVIDQIMFDLLEEMEGDPE